MAPVSLSALARSAEHGPGLLAVNGLEPSLEPELCNKERARLEETGGNTAHCTAQYCAAFLRCTVRADVAGGVQVYSGVV